MKRTPRQFDRERWVELTRIERNLPDVDYQAVDLTIDILAKQGYGTLVNIAHLADWLFTPAPVRRGKKGQPLKWDDDKKIKAWFGIEVEVLLARIKEPGLGVESAMRRVLQRSQGQFHVPWSGLVISTAGRAKRIHDMGKSLLKSDPGLKKMWHERVELVVRHRAGAVRILPAKDSL
jgi:hypothetical protein